jgi:putative ABC transport system permease protein
MQIKIILKVATKSIMKSRMRSLLTALGIIIGVSAVVVMVAIGDGAQLKVEQQILSSLHRGLPIPAASEAVQEHLTDLLLMMWTK